MNAPDNVVDGRTRLYGRFTTRPARVDPLAEFGPLARPLRRLRLKEWVGFTLVHPEWASSMIIQDAHYLASSEIYVAHRTDGTRFEHAANARGGSLRLPAGFYGREMSFDRPGYRIRYELDTPETEADARHVVRIDIDATATAPAFTGELVLHHAGASAPLSVSSVLPGGRNRLYTHKALYPVSGSLRTGDREIVFDPRRDLAILDEHRSLLPYRTRWIWGTFAFPMPDGPVGANFADRPEVPGQEEESGIWAADGVEPLADVTFTPTGDPETTPWRITSADGRLDATFTPQGRKHVVHQLGLFAIDYFQMFGRYDGTLRAGGRTYALKGVHGVCESMRARL
ncbi:DUF2804 domain-containing protein [Antribacter gilvus]|uniref:DUF2804 domain-containing protein n=1 Tax=Antribacter gilvus TaxID=2304675 RepID=UPI000F7A8845|nr:DUF2804 domain-containing protein [Antribacter gilvus]